MRSISRLTQALLIIGICGAVIRPAAADVTVTMRGSFVTSPGFQAGGSLSQKMNILLNGTAYYRGHSARYESGPITVLDRQQDNRVIVYNDSTQRYAVLKDFDLSLADNLRKYIRTHGYQATVHAKIHHTYNLMFDHHRCRRYEVYVTVTVPGIDVTVSGTYDCIYAVDFPGVKFVNTIAGHTKITGVLLRDIEYMRSNYAAMTARTDAVAISTNRLAESDFELGSSYTATSANALGFGNSMDLAEGGLMSSKPVDPYADFNQFTGAKKAQALIANGKFDDAGELVRSLAKRGMNKHLGHVYSELGDHSENQGKADEAWGWYTLAAENSDAPDDIVHAYFALERYYADMHDSADAAKQLQAIIDLPSAKQADKDQAATMLKPLTAK